MSWALMLAAGTLAGTIIGAGVFALPYLVGKLGAVTGLFYLCGASLVYYGVHRMYAAVVAGAPPGHDFLTFVRARLPRVAAFIASLTVIGELVFTLVVYLALAPTFLALIVPLPTLSATLLFWVIGSLFVFVRLSWQGFAEFSGTLLIGAIIVVILLAGGAAPLDIPLVRSLDLSTAFLPLGALLFAFAGRPAVALVVKEWRGAARSFSLGRAVFWGTFVPAALYAIFVFAILRLNPSVTPEALNSLGFLSPSLLMALGAMGFLTLWTSYFMIGANLKDILHLDLKIHSWLVAIVVLVFPLALYLAGFNAFFDALSFTGSVFLALEGLFVVWLWRRTFPSHRFRFVSIPLSFVFTLALVYEVLSRFRVI